MCACVCVCARYQHFSAHKTTVDTTSKMGTFVLPKCDNIFQILLSTIKTLIVPNLVLI